MKDLLVITGMPVRYKGFLYNCMVSVVNGLVVFIYPKSVLCNDDVYRESRWFVPWLRKNEVVDFSLPTGHGFKQVCAVGSPLRGGVSGRAIEPT